MKKYPLIIGIVFLFMVSSLTPIVFGYNVRLSYEKEPQSTSSGSGLMDSAWPMKCHDLHHTSQSPYSTANVDGLEKWRFHTTDSIEGGPVIDSDGTIYFWRF